jgi:hypothetical protein
MQKLQGKDWTFKTPVERDVAYTQDDFDGLPF